MKQISLGTIRNYITFFNEVLLPSLKLAKGEDITLSYLFQNIILASEFRVACSHFEHKYKATVSKNTLAALAKEGIMFKRLEPGYYHILFSPDFKVDPAIARNIIQAVNKYQTKRKKPIVIAKKEKITPEPNTVGKYMPVEDVKILLNIAGDTTEPIINRLIRAYELGRKFAKEHPLM